MIPADRQGRPYRRRAANIAKHSFHGAFNAFTPVLPDFFCHLVYQIILFHCDYLCCHTDILLQIPDASNVNWIHHRGAFFATSVRTIIVSASRLRADRKGLPVDR
jgi:hypothetical protein